MKKWVILLFLVSLPVVYSENFDNYKDGEWIAIYEKNVIAHGLTLKKVLEKDKKI